MSKHTSCKHSPHTASFSPQLSPKRWSHGCTKYILTSMFDQSYSVAFRLLTILLQWSLLGSISKSRQSSPQTGGTRNKSEPSRGTPSLMNSYRKRVQSNTIHQKHDVRYFPCLTPPWFPEESWGDMYSSSGPQSGAELSRPWCKCSPTNPL